MGSLLLCAGERGQRKSLPNSRIMMHQPLGGTQVCALPGELLKETTGQSDSTC